MIGSILAVLSWIVALWSIFIATSEKLIFPFNYYFYCTALFFATIGGLLWEVSSCSVYLKKIYKIQRGELKGILNSNIESNIKIETSENKDTTDKNEDRLIGQNIENNIKSIASVATAKVKEIMQKRCK